MLKEFVSFRNFRRGKMVALKQIVVIMTTLISVSAVTHPVGGPSGWNINSDIEGWTAETIFSVGDFLEFQYKPVHNVLEVHPLDYRNCNAAHPISTHDNGLTVIKLTQPGPRFFICGKQYHCRRGLKLQVKVLPQLSNDNNNGTTTPTAMGPSSSPATQGRLKP